VNMTEIAVLFAKVDSIYKSIPGCDVFDIERDALNYQGPYPIIAHPPCRGWGNLRKMSNHTDAEKALGPWAIKQVQKYGGVLEHPRGSTLWEHARLPLPKEGQDQYGGFTISIDQYWFGHRAQKATWLYICGCSPSDVPQMPIKLGPPSHVVTNRHGLRAGMPGYRKEITKPERSATPLVFAEWLIDLVKVINTNPTPSNP